MDFEERIKKMFQKTREDIERVGWSAIGVFTTEEDPDFIPFTYSIGFTERGHPEVIVFALSPDQAHGLINSAYVNISELGKQFKDGDIAENIIREPYKVMFRKVPPPGRPANWARHYYGGGAVEVLQIVWPDEEGNYPWEEDWDQNMRQPVMADEPDYPQLQGEDDDV